MKKTMYIKPWISSECGNEFSSQEKDSWTSFFEIQGKHKQKSEPLKTENFIYLFHFFKNILSVTTISAHYNIIFNYLNNIQCFFFPPKEHK